MFSTARPTFTSIVPGFRNFSTTNPCNMIRKMTRFHVVDNSELGRQAAAEGRLAKCIHVYNKQEVGTIGDKVLVAIRGQKKKGVVVGVRMHQSHGIPRFDKNCIVLLNEDGMPLGNRITSPLPTLLRKKYAGNKMLAIATRFV